MRQKMTVAAIIVAAILVLTACGTPIPTVPPRLTPVPGPSFAPLPAALFPTFDLSQAVECRAQLKGETLFILSFPELAGVISAIASLQVGPLTERESVEYIDYLFQGPSQSWTLTVGRSTVMMPDGPHALFGAEWFYQSVQAALIEP